MLNYVCKICGKTFNHHIPYIAHLRDVHHLNAKEYYDKHVNTGNEGKCAVCGKNTVFISILKGYHECCSTGCANTLRAKKASGCDVTCAICNTILHSEGTTANVYTKLFYHINTVHGITSQKEYYDTYIKKPDEGKCPICGKETGFKSIALGYNTYCSAKCSVENAKQTENSAINTFKAIKNEQNIINKIINSIKDKYQKFINGGDKKLNFSDIRDNPVNQKTVSETKHYTDPEKPDTQLTIKTEISTTSTYDWLGSQEYSPKYEHCSNNKNYNNYNDYIDDDQQFSSNEWC